MANGVALQQGQNLTATDDKYVRDRPEDLLLIELNELQEKDMIAQRAQELKETKDCFIKNYLYLFGRSKEQARNLSRDKQIALANLLLKKTKPLAILQLIMLPIFVCIPIFGWLKLYSMWDLDAGGLFLLTWAGIVTLIGLLSVLSNQTIHSYYYRMYLLKLKSMCGEENWFPHELL